VPEAETVNVASPEAQAWSQTPAVDPGGKLAVGLRIDPVNPYRPGVSIYPFMVKSRSLQQPEGTLVVEEGESQFTGMTPFQRYGPSLAIFASAFIVISIIAVLVF
jgi:hypothetical protein